MSDVVVVGDALIDEVHVEGTVVDVVGGAALNVAAGLRVLGRESSLVAMVGDDPGGSTIRRHLHEIGVPLAATPAPNGTARAISRRSSGAPEYTFNEAARQRLVPIDNDALQLIRQTPLVVVSCVALDRDEQCSTILDAIDDPGTRLIIDPNPRAGMLVDRERFASNLLELASKSLVVKVSDEDADLLGFNDLPELSRVLRNRGARFVLSTAGALGVRLDGDGIGIERPIHALADPIVDTMGAGDATLAVVVDRLVAGIPSSSDEWGRILRDAMTVAALTCRSIGPNLRLPGGHRRHS